MGRRLFYLQSSYTANEYMQRTCTTSYAVPPSTSHGTTYGAVLLHCMRIYRACGLFNGSLATHLEHLPVQSSVAMLIDLKFTNEWKVRSKSTWLRHRCSGYGDRSKETRGTNALMFPRADEFVLAQPDARQTVWQLVQKLHICLIGRDRIQNVLLQMQSLSKYKSFGHGEGTSATVSPVRDFGCRIGALLNSFL